MNPRRYDDGDTALPGLRPSRPIASNDDRASSEKIGLKEWPGDRTADATHVRLALVIKAALDSHRREVERLANLVSDADAVRCEGIGVSISS